MKMRALPTLDLRPARRWNSIRGYHVMLMDLKQPLAAGATVPGLRRPFKDGKGVEAGDA